MLLALLAALTAHHPSQDSVVGIRPADSVVVHRGARRAQAEFERRRVALLPVTAARGDRCDVRIGRYCYWVNDADSAPPEPAKIAPLRRKLLDGLDAAARTLPGDRWISGQRVRYLVEAGRHDDAVAAAAECRAAAPWCASLTALALHAKGDFVAADSAVDAAVSAMSDAERCEATNFETIVGEPLRRRFREASCVVRDSLAARWMWLATPWYSRPGNPIRSELVARRVMASLAGDSRSPFSPSIGRDLQELVIRYGWPTGWAKHPAPSAYSAATDGGAVGYDPPGSLAFGALAAAVEDPTTIDDGSWRIEARAAPARFVAPNARAVGRVARRIALFRRGDSALVVAAFDAASDTALRTVAAPRTALVLLRDEYTDPIVVASPDTSRVGVVTASAPWRPQLVAVEVYDSASARGARSRDGIAPEDTAGGPVGLSSLLLFAADTLPPAQLDSVFARAIAGRIAQDAKLGLFWEMYGIPDRERVTASIGLVPEPSGGLRRLAEAIGVMEPRTPVRLSWEDAPAIDGSVGGRALLLGLEGIPPGRYRVELSVSVAGQPARRTASAVEIVSR